MSYSIASAQNPGEGVAVDNPIEADDFETLLKAIANIVMRIGGVLAVIFIIWSGYLFVTARGDDKQLETAKNVFFWTIIGTAILLGAYVIATAVVNFVKSL